MSWSRIVIAILVATFATATPYLEVSAQEGAEVPRVSLSSPDASFPEPFSNLIGLRELSDGRVVISDRLEQAVRILDFASGSFEEVGGVGQGPGEYKMPGMLFPLAADSTLLVDFGNMRMTSIGPSGEMGASWSLIHASRTLIIPAGTDAAGRLYFDGGGQITMNMGSRSAEAEPQIPVVRLDRGSGAIDTVAVIQPPETGGVEVRGGGDGGDRDGWGFSGFTGMPAFTAQDVWAVAPDGRIGIARVSDYHVDWIEPDGSITSGPAVQYEPVPITEQDKEAWADRLASRAVVMMQSVDGSGSSSRSMDLPRPDIDQIAWPEAKPPFGNRAVTVTPEGALWVQRHVPFGEPATFDVFDESGQRIRQVTLPEERTVVGFGQGTVYTIVMDEDDLQWLERYVRDS